MMIDTRYDDMVWLPDNFFSSRPLEQDTVLSEKSAKISEPANESMTSSDYLVAFSTRQRNYCVGLVDMVDSTKISSSIGQKRIPRYYEIFLNSLSKVLGRFGGFVIKNVGDSLFFYFPESGKPKRKFGFLSCLECCLSLSELHDHLCAQLKKEDLPVLDYRISADYGTVAVMQANNSTSIDMIGPPVNMCSKINHYAKINQVVIGGDLYQMVKRLHDYSFKQINSYSLGMRYSYPVYSVSRKAE